MGMRQLYRSSSGAARWGWSLPVALLAEGSGSGFGQARAGDQGTGAGTSSLHPTVRCSTAHDAEGAALGPAAVTPISAPLMILTIFTQLVCGFLSICRTGQAGWAAVLNITARGGP